MASTAWTVDRAQLVEQLAKTRAERDLVTERLRLALAREAERKQRQREHKRLQRERDRNLEQARTTATVALLPPDPNAAQHRADLLAALKEKP